MGGSTYEGLLAAARSPHPLRKHQGAALEAVMDAYGAGGTRASVTLPPGEGKTLLGLETARRLGRRTVALGPNTAIQSQWLGGWDRFFAHLGDARDPLVVAADDRKLERVFTALTYQALATFDPDAETHGTAAHVSGDGLLSRLHPNGADLIARMRDAGPLLLILDECHHLLEVWGRLVSEVLAQIPGAIVLGLTATPPMAMTAAQADLADSIFGKPAYVAHVPAAIREGNLAPFAELAWLTTPTARESSWLDEQATRFSELVVLLSDPSFGSVPFLDWLRRRFVEPAAGAVPWAKLAQGDPALCDAALRAHFKGLMDLPPGARLQEQHRRDLDADDWVNLIDDWMRHSVAGSDASEDLRVVEAVKTALPSVGYQWTRHGIRAGRSAVDRVLARSESKMVAATAIVAAESSNLGARLRMLVLCDHERATATLPVALSGVVTRESGSARLCLERLVGDPTTRDLAPMLLTGSTVAGEAPTVRAFLSFVSGESPEVAARIVVGDADGSGVAEITGSWTPRTWVPLATRFFEAGGCQVLVGTRALLGEGWDAPSVTGVVDLTSATTLTSVVQMRGRALRLDPKWPEKVALTWSVVCVSGAHPRGANDWGRFVRKHAGFLATDQSGAIVDGVAHVDAAFSPFAPPAEDSFPATNAAMLVRAEQRPVIAERWQVGTPYEDELVEAIRLEPKRSGALRSEDVPPAIVLGPDPVPCTGTSSPWRPGLGAVASGVGGVVVALAAGAGLSVVLGVVVLVVALALAVAVQMRAAVGRVRHLVESIPSVPSVEQIGKAVADGFLHAGMSDAGADHVRVVVEPDGQYRCLLTGVTLEESARFVQAFDEVISPITSPRYLVPRWIGPTIPAGRAGRSAARAIARSGVRPVATVWHAVPTDLGTNARRAEAFGQAWHRWVGGGAPVRTATPEGAGALAASQGADPLDAISAVRLHWN